MDPKALRIGLSVNIKRSDGRVHGAVITGIDTEKQYVSVEWFENGETKGKEVDFDQIYHLNTELFTKPVLRSNSRKTIATPSKAQPRPSQLRAVENVVGSSKPPPKAVAAIAPRARPNAQDVPPPLPPSRGIGRGRSELPLPRAVAHPPPPLAVPKQPSPPLAVPKQPSPPLAVVKEPSPPLAVAKEPKEKVLGPKSRKSNVVKEIEKLKKNREERRAKQAEQIKIRNVEYDPTNPNWEFQQKIREFRAKLELRPLVGDEPVSYSRICVCVRKRPLNRKEQQRKEIDVITVPDRSSMQVHEPKVKVDLTKYLDNQIFRFDYSFDENIMNEVVYRYTAQPLVHTIFERGMATCFAYGQTGSGKTHTMGGEFSGKEQDAARGIYAFAAADVFRLNSLPENESKGLDISASFFEIYSGKVYDLLNRKKKLRILEDAKQQVQVVGLSEEPVSCVDDVLQLIQIGNVCRTSGTTSANQHSSRSHAVFQIFARKRTSGRLYGKFSLIDLAGNERGADTATADRHTRMEGAEINRSLLALKECIRALGRKGAHLPFRGSKLTQVLKDSFVGDNSRTCMIAMISPGLNSCEHTLNTLRYADRVKELRPNQGGPAAQPPGGPDPLHLKPLEEHPPPPGENDLQYLHRSLSLEDGVEMDRSVELLTFHEAISNLLESEDLVVEEHRALVQETEQLLEEDKKLLEYVDDVDHDMEEYVKSLEDIVEQKLQLFAKFKDRLREHRQRLLEEETASRNVVKHLPSVR